MLNDVVLSARQQQVMAGTYFPKSALFLGREHEEVATEVKQRAKA